MKKRILTFVIALLCVIAMPQVALAATSSGSCGVSATWNYNNGTLTISGKGVVDAYPWMDSYEDSITKVVVNEGITEFSKWSAFEGCDALVDVSLPQSLTRLANYAFKGCDALKSITIPKNLTEAGFCFKDSGLQTITFENGATAVPSFICENSPSLSTISFPASMKKIGTSAFENCDALTSVQLPNQLDTLENYAFKSCDGVKSITIPKTVKSASFSFKDSGLETITFENGTTEIPSFICENCPKLTTINFVQSIKKIGTSAFENCDALTTVQLPKQLTTLDNYVFKACDGIKSITIPKTVTQASYSFRDSALEAVTFEDGATVVPAFMFASCEKLTTVNWPQTLKKIETSAFEYCTGLTKLELPWYLDEIGFYSFKNCNNLKEITIYQNTKKINDYAFKYLEKITVCGKKNSEAHKYAKKMGYNFKSCKVPALKGITYTKGNLKYKVVTDYINGKGTVMVTGMKKNASSVTIPKTVKLESYSYKVVKINNNAFKGKSKIKKITIKSTTITSVGKNAIKGINKKATIKVPKSKKAAYKRLFKKSTGYVKTMKIK